MRVTAAFNRMLALPGTTVREVWFEPAQITVTVALRRRRLVCADCSYSTPARYDTRTVDSRWRHLDLGRLRLVVKARLRRLACPHHGVRTEQVPFARPESGFTRDVEDLVAWLATRMDKSAVGRLVRIAWQTVGAICERVVADELDAGRLDELFEVGVDEVSWRKGHRYLTLVTDHRTRRVVWGSQGKDTATLDRFFTDLGADRAAQLAAVSTDMGPAFLKSVTAGAPQATVCIDPFHVVKLASDALDTVRRQVWNQLRAIDPGKAKRFKGARWVLPRAPRALVRHPGRHPAHAAPPGWGGLARLRAQGGPAGGVRRRSERQRGGRVARPLVRQGQPQPPGAARQARRYDPHPSRRHPGRTPPWHQQRPRRGAQQQGAAHHPPRLRVPLCRGCACARHACLRPDYPAPAT